MESRGKQLIQLIMKIPVFEHEAPLNQIMSETYEIELTDPRAALMAFENVEWQTDDTYFDASLEVYIDGELFFKNDTTDAHGLWRDFVNATLKPDNHIISFLDSPGDLQLIHQQHYTFQYVHTDYEWDEKGCLLSRTDTMITSEPVPKEAVEPAIRDSFLHFAQFILTHDIPVAKVYKEELKQQIHNWKAEE